MQLYPRPICTYIAYARLDTINVQDCHLALAQSQCVGTLRNTCNADQHEQKMMTYYY